MFTEPVGTQSVPSPMTTPWAWNIVTGAVLPYSEMFVRGDQMTAVPSRASSCPSRAVMATLCVNAAFGPVRSTPPLALLLRQRNSLCA